MKITTEKLNKFHAQTGRDLYSQLGSRFRDLSVESTYIAEVPSISVVSIDKKQVFDFLLNPHSDWNSDYIVYRWNGGQWEKASLVKKSWDTMTIKWTRA